MKHSILLLTILFLLVARPAPALTQTDWVGQYLMNHNGSKVRLIIAPAPTSPDLNHASVTYIDVASNGRAYPGGVESFDHDFQHMVFYIQFESFRTRFDAYLFTGDKDQMAGTTVLGGTTLGFVARREPATMTKGVAPGAPSGIAAVVEPAPNTSSTPVQITIDTNGGVTVARNGVQKHLQAQAPAKSCGKCDSATSSGQPSVPQPEVTWFTQHGNALLDAIGVAAPSQVNNQVNYENKVGADLRARVDMRTDTLRRILLLTGQ